MSHIAWIVLVVVTVLVTSLIGAVRTGLELTVDEEP